MFGKFRIAVIVTVALLLAIFLIGAAPARTTEAAGYTSYHVVHYGETLTSIAEWYGVSVWQLACANGIYNANYIYAGMVLYVPHWYGGGYGCHSYNPPPPSTCYYNCGYHADCYYRVRWGDNLSWIAWHFGTSYYALAYANHLYNPNLIYAGMVLRIPGCN